MTKAATKPKEAIMVSADIAEAFKKEARLRHVTVETFIRSMLEDSADIRSADAALKKHRAAGEKTASLAEVKKSLGLVR